ncbi:hypothetical protein G6O69_23910 [Pseudenhygromyxa sp. WMMC2535]|uniref:hypothetical protein n=1 Tax=Pseudenhygromyxa sp. WMMC2535 TaxID=2712867 RepID=UPI0015570743|nr:hypothetical protein [Pseudenhygromyxa sp. WMMC2535]NVB40906.1 hypothetical protein [Pseudenhygromyxa sp. WMMC2535]
MRATEPASRWQLAALLAVIAFILLSAFPYFEQIRNANELPRLVQAMSLVDEHTWAVDGPSRHGLALGPDLARSPVDGRLYPNKPPGASVVGAAAYALAKLGTQPPSLRELTWWARLLAGVVPTLIIALFAWGRLRPRFGPLVSAATIFLGIFATPLFAYARLFYGHALAACLLYIGVLALERGLHGPPAKAARACFWGGLAAACAVTVEYGAAFAGLPIAVALLWTAAKPSAGTGAPARATRLRNAGLALAGALIPVLALAGYQWSVFGSPLATGYHHAADAHFAALHGQGLLGLGAPRWDNVVTHLLSPKTGLLVWSPLCLLAFAGLVHGARRADADAEACRLQLGVFALVLLMGLGLSFSGGWRVGPRYLVVALPMLLLGLAEFIAAFSDRSRMGALLMGLLAITASWSLIANAMAATIWPHIDPTNISEPFGAVLIPLWLHGFAPYGLPSAMSQGLTICLAIPVLVGVGALSWAAGTEQPRMVLLPMFLGYAIGALGLLLVLPRTIPAHPATEHNLEYIERVYEPGPARTDSERSNPRGESLRLEN